MNPETSFTKKIKKIVIGSPHNPHDKKIFHKLSLIAFLAWIGLGADGLTSSCYGPEEAFLGLQGHFTWSIFVALASAMTVFVISSSYNQIIELFPSGGGGYLVASKLLNPSLGMVSGCALVIDYVLTIAISIASGVDALFSFFSPEMQFLKIWISLIIVLFMIIMNLRGVKESVVFLIPIFLAFIFSHVFFILYGIFNNVTQIPSIAQQTAADLSSAYSDPTIGLLGIFLIIMKSYSMGAGTYTGIEAVSNGMPILREPKVKTARKTMRYMSFSLAFLVVGLMLGYLFYHVSPQTGKTLNAVLFENITQNWNPNFRSLLIFITLFSEALLLAAAAQTGFMGGPRVMANMAADKWIPTRFNMLSDRFVTQNGILFMGTAAAIMLIFTHGSVKYLVVLYSINVFVTFALSQLGMVRYWYKAKETVKRWKRKLAVNFIGLLITIFILVSVTVFKFFDGGWITFLVTGIFIVIAISIKKYYVDTFRSFGRLDDLIETVELSFKYEPSKALPPYHPSGKTAVVMVNGYNGLGLHTLFTILRSFKDVYKNFIFVQIGVIDAGNFKGQEEIKHLEEHIAKDLTRYVKMMNHYGYHAEYQSVIGVDVVKEISQLAPEILKKHPNAVFFGGQLVFMKESFISEWLHNYTIFAVQKNLYRQGILLVILPIRIRRADRKTKPHIEQNVKKEEHKADET